jgi:hypothetical protein
MGVDKGTRKHLLMLVGGLSKMFKEKIYMNKKDNIYYCFRYKCKRCPKQRECEEEQKRGDNNAKTKQVQISRGNANSYR